MSHRALLALALVVLAALATPGCLGDGPATAETFGGANPTATASPDSPTATTAPPASPTATAPSDSPTTPSPAGSPTVTTGGYDCPYYLTAEPATESQRDRIDRTVSYENLTATRRSEFDRMREGELELETLPEQWSAPVLVDYDGTLYYVVASTC